MNLVAVFAQVDRILSEKAKYHRFKFSIFLKKIKKANLMISLPILK